MHILYIHQYFSTRSGSTGTRSFEFARRWVRQGHRVTMLTGMVDLSGREGAGGWLSRNEIEGIEVLRVRAPYSNRMGFARRVLAFAHFMLAATWAGLFKSGRIDGVLATSTPLTVGIPGRIVSLLRRVPFVFEIRDLWPQAPIELGALRQPLLVAVARGLERRLYRVADHVVTLSPGMHDALVAMDVPENKLSMIPNCSDCDLFQPGPADADLIAQHGTEVRFVLIYAGAMGRANGLESVVDTAAILLERGETRPLFLLVGDGMERPTLETRIASLGLDNVRLIAPMPKSELARFLRLSDVILTFFAPYPVLTTCSPNKMFDGLALGRPILTNFGGWTQQVLQDAEAGVAVPSDDPSDLADAVVALAADPDRLAIMGANARRLAEERFSRDLLSDQMLEVLRRTIEGERV